MRLCQEPYSCQITYSRMSACLALGCTAFLWKALLSFAFPPSHLGKSSKLVCTRFGVSYLDILDFCFLEYHNVILSFSILIGVRLLSFWKRFSTSACPFIEEYSECFDYIVQQPVPLFHMLSSL